MTAALVRAGIVATLLDLLAFAAWIIPGTVVERNPLIAGIDPVSAILARLSAVVLIASLGFVAERADDRLLTFAVRLLGAVALVVGVLGTATTLGSLR